MFGTRYIPCFIVLLILLILCVGVKSNTNNLSGISGFNNEGLPSNLNNIEGFDTNVNSIRRITSTEEGNITTETIDLWRRKSYQKAYSQCRALFDEDLLNTGKPLDVDIAKKYVQKMDPCGRESKSLIERKNLQYPNLAQKECNPGENNSMDNRCKGEDPHILSRFSKGGIEGAGHSGRSWKSEGHNPGIIPWYKEGDYKDKYPDMGYGSRGHNWEPYYDTLRTYPASERIKDYKEGKVFQHLNSAPPTCWDDPLPDPIYRPIQESPLPERAFRVKATQSYQPSCFPTPGPDSSSPTANPGYEQKCTNIDIVSHAQNLDDWREECEAEGCSYTEPKKDCLIPNGILHDYRILPPPSSRGILPGGSICYEDYCAYVIDPDNRGIDSFGFVGGDTNNDGIPDDPLGEMCTSPTLRPGAGQVLVPPWVTTPNQEFWVEQVNYRSGECTWDDMNPYPPYLRSSPSASNPFWHKFESTNNILTQPWRYESPLRDMDEIKLTDNSGEDFYTRPDISAERDQDGHNEGPSYRRPNVGGLEFTPKLMEHPSLGIAYYCNEEENWAAGRGDKFERLDDSKARVCDRMTVLNKQSGTMDDRLNPFREVLDKATWYERDRRQRTTMELINDEVKKVELIPGTSPAPIDHLDPEQRIKPPILIPHRSFGDTLRSQISPNNLVDSSNTWATRGPGPGEGNLTIPTPIRFSMTMPTNGPGSPGVGGSYIGRLGWCKEKAHLSCNEFLQSNEDYIKCLAKEADNVGLRTQMAAYMRDTLNDVGYIHNLNTFEPTPDVFGPELEWVATENPGGRVPERCGLYEGAIHGANGGLGGSMYALTAAEISRCDWDDIRGTHGLTPCNPESILSNKKWCAAEIQGGTAAAVACMTNDAASLCTAPFKAVWEGVENAVRPFFDWVNPHVVSAAGVVVPNVVRYVAAPQAAPGAGGNAAGANAGQALQAAGGGGGAYCVFGSSAPECKEYCRNAPFCFGKYG